MFCKACGTNYNDVVLYCKNDGHALTELITESYTLLSGEVKFCANCGDTHQTVDNYCSKCGVSSSSITEQNDFRLMGSTSIPLSTSVQTNHKLSLHEIISMTSRGWFGSLISIVLLFILSAVISKSISTVVNRYINSELKHMGGFFNAVSSNIKVLGFDDVMLMSNLISSTLKLDAGSTSSASASMHIGLLALLLVPFISLFVGGFVAAKKIQITRARDSFTLSIGIGVVYAVFLGLVSLVGGTSQDIPVPMGLVKGGISFVHSFSFFGALFQGLFFGILFSFFGALFALGSYRITAHLRQIANYGESLHQAFSTLFWGVLITLVYLFIVISLKADGEIPLWALLLFVPQGALYLWNIAQLNTLSLSGGDTLSDMNHFTVTIFKGMQGVGDEADILNPYIYLSFLIVLVLFLMAGSRLKHASLPLSKSLLVFSGTYALLMAILVGIAKFSMRVQGKIPFLEANELPIASGGFGIISTFFICFFVSGIIAFIGASFSKHLSISTYLNK
ncbi:zinc ribbon domain-containing protein [Paenibacillus alginolyticus]|uniref:Zinc ribbon domain-containing protein n=1 Tax=Paenibacillus alginolyticus TaxID=59839 RepID=A0ABT4G7C1_9BACL|nr:zinc ribbon domain-containing protein [Paenibacillus alginolyticus]MCY9692062.1 zinc ribbon domain-containing protein [Paenibacillus alginolyticus]MEC0144252.1 zinc ribbon domain-containing protein [Paenibacillus alginolyticus]